MTKCNWTKTSPIECLPEWWFAHCRVATKKHRANSKKTPVVVWDSQWWFGIPRVPLSNNPPFIGGSQESKPRGPQNQQVTLSWPSSHQQKTLEQECQPSQPWSSSIGSWNKTTKTRILSPNFIWLVVSTHSKNISQIGSSPQLGVKIKNPWNHHPVMGKHLCSS